MEPRLVLDDVGQVVSHGAGAQDLAPCQTASRELERRDEEMAPKGGRSGYMISAMDRFGGFGILEQYGAMVVGVRRSDEQQPSFSLIMRSLDVVASHDDL